jgi:hypothetical protein
LQKYCELISPKEGYFMALRRSVRRLRPLYAGLAMLLFVALTLAA